MAVSRVRTKQLLVSLVALSLLSGCSRDALPALASVADPPLRSIPEVGSTPRRISAHLLAAGAAVICWADQRDLYCRPRFPLDNGMSIRVLRFDQSISKVEVVGLRICASSAGNEYQCATWTPRRSATQGRDAVQESTVADSVGEMQHGVIAFSYERMCLQRGESVVCRGPDSLPFSSDMVSDIDGSCYLLNDGRAWCSAVPSACTDRLRAGGFLRRQNAMFLSSPVGQHAVCVASSRQVECSGLWAPTRGGETHRCLTNGAVEFELPDDVRSLSVSVFGVCAVTVSGDLYCWGDPYFGPVHDVSWSPRKVASEVDAVVLTQLEWIAHVCIRYRNSPVPVCTRRAPPIAHVAGGEEPKYKGSVPGTRSTARPWSARAARMSRFWPPNIGQLRARSTIAATICSAAAEMDAAARR